MTCYHHTVRKKNEYDIKSGGIIRLVPNLMSKKNYVVHYRNLQYYLSQRFNIKKGS